MSDNYREIVEKVNAAFSKGNIEGFLELCTDDIRWTIVNDQTVPGKDAIREFMKDTGDTEPPTFTTDEIIVENDSAVCYGQMTMKEKEGCAGIYEYCDIYGFKDKKISKLRTFMIKLEEVQGSPESPESLGSSE